MADFLDAAADLIGDIASPYALITQAGRSIGGIVPNVTIQETIADENTITIHPVQSGTPVSDHIFANPVVVDMVVGFSDSTGGYPGYSIDIYNIFLSLRDTRQPFDVYTGKRMFKNMLFGSIVPTTDETNEYALMLRVRLQEVIISGTATANSDNQKFPQKTGDENYVGVTTPQPYLGGGIGGIPVANPAATGGIGRA